MYEVIFNTRDFHSRRNRRDWQALLMNDFAVAVNGKTFECETEIDLKNRLSFISGHCYSSENEDVLKVWDEYEKNPDNYFELTDDRYNTQRLKYGMYGIAQGYVDKDKVIERVNENGSDAIPFNDFYDLRQGSFFDRCYVEIKKV